MAKLEDAIDVFRGFDDRFVFEYGRNEAVSERATGLECLHGQEWGILLKSKESKHGLVGIDRRGQQRGEVAYSLRRV